jgi:hypothetical protein
VKNQPSDNNTEHAIREYSLRSYQELDVLVIRGMELNFNYEVRDPSVDFESGTAHRVGAGFEVHPIPHVELKTLYRHTMARL